MKKMIWLTTSFVLILLFIVPIVLASALKMVPGNVQPGYNPNLRLSIYSIREFSQKFISTSRNLTAIGTSIRNPNLKNKSDVIFNLYDENGGLIRTVTLSGQNIEDGSFIKFTFPVIPESLNKSYSFTISSPGAGAEETIEVFILNEPDLSSGITEYSYLGETHAGGTPLVLFNRPDSRLKTVKSIYINWFSRLLSLRSQKFE
jgi:hypothetical protein